MIRTKSTDDVELISLIFQTILNIVYITYGILMQEIPILISESIALIICSSMIILKKMYDNKKTTKMSIEDISKGKSEDTSEDTSEETITKVENIT